MKKNINQITWGIMLSYVSLIAGNMIQLIYTPIMLRILGQNEYGLYNLASSTVANLGLLSFGFASAYIRYYTKFKAKKLEEEIKRLNGLFLIVYSVIGLIALIAGGVLVNNIDLLFKNSLTFEELSRARTLMLIMIINIAITFPASVFQSNVTANERYFFQKLLNLIKVVINPFLMLPILLLGFQSIGMAFMTTLVTIITTSINIYYCLKVLNMKFLFRKIDFNLMKEVWSFSFFIFLNIIVDQINWNVDRFLLGMFKGTIAVAVYGVAAQFNTMYLNFAGCLSQIFIPKINTIVNKSDNTEILNDLFCRIGRLQFIILSLIMTGFILFGKKFIELWAGRDYSDSYIIALILMLPVTIELIQSIGMEILKAKNLHKFRSILFLILSVGNIFISIPLCIKLGGIGCAIGTAFSLILGNGIIINIYYYKKVGLNIFLFWCEIFKLSIALVWPLLVGVILILTFDMNKIYIYIISIVIYVIVFSLSMWKFGLNKSEKRLVLNLIERVKI